MTTATRHKPGELERGDQAQKIFEPKKGRRRTQHRNQLRARRNGRANTSGGRSTYVRTLSTYLRMYVRTYVKTYAIATYVRKYQGRGGAMGGGGRGERQGRIGVGGGLTRATILGDRRRTTTKRGSFCTPRRSMRLPSNCWHRAPYPSSLAPHLPPVSETTSFIAHLCGRTFVLQRLVFNHI